MAEEFAQITAPEQAKIFRALAVNLGRSPAVLEKDYWACVVLEALFARPGQKPMAFKGGTSLSKVYNAIARFSEDIDVTIDYRALGAGIDPFADGVTRSQIKKCSKILKQNVHAYVVGEIQPHLAAALVERAARPCEIEVDNDGERLTVAYPSTLESVTGEYIGRSVLVEFGGRNVVEPSEQHQVAPDIAAGVPGIIFPTALVTVLSGTRTFWEKATLMHVACNGNLLESGAERLSRHWYDLAMLADHEIGGAAIQDRQLLADVVKLKKVFFDAAGADYDACLSGGMTLVPEDKGLRTLKEDYRQMIDAGMFIGKPMPFDHIVERLKALEQVINYLDKSDDKGNNDRAKASSIFKP